MPAPFSQGTLQDSDFLIRQQWQPLACAPCSQVPPLGYLTSAKSHMGAGLTSAKFHTDASSSTGLFGDTDSNFQ